MVNPSPNDRAALDLAIEIARRDSVQRRRIDEALAAGRDYFEVGKGAAAFCQHAVLGLQPWQSPPCRVSLLGLDEPYGDASGRREAAELVLRMRRCNVSRWHPDPVRECDRAEAARRSAD